MNTQREDAMELHHTRLADTIFGGGFPYGGDYNPEQWDAAMGYPDEEVWREDIRLMTEAGVTMVTVGVFSWAMLQPAEGVYTFDWLDRILDLLHTAHIRVCLATATAAQPAWLSMAYPEALPVTADGHRRHHGQRMNYCPTNPDFRRLANALVSRLAERYGAHPALRLWHVSNEYGPHCYCATCAARFRLWLQERYGSLAALNRQWTTPFWSHIYTTWEQIEPPTPLGEYEMPGIVLDYQRFLSDMNLASYQAEAAILRAATPQVPITTNFHGLVKSIDYVSWAPHVDLVAWDAYPTLDAHPSDTAFYFDLMRGLRNGQPWLLMEQTPGQVQWRAQNPLKRPGAMRLQSYQALAHGADGAMFFQWRQSRGGAEMFHSGIVTHANSGQTRIFREIAALGEELRQLDHHILGAHTPARVALLMSWPNWWAVEAATNPSHTINYLATLHAYHRALWEQRITVDVIAPDQPLDGYDAVIAPLWMMVDERQSQAIEHYVAQGGVFLTTFMSGLIGPDGRAWLTGYPGPLRRTLGIWVEEVDPLLPHMTNTVVGTDALPISASCSLWGEVVHLEGAEALATFGADYYAGRPAITRHAFGAGTAYYVATRLDTALDHVLAHLLSAANIVAPLAAPPDVEVTERRNGDATYFFILNHHTDPREITLPTPMRDLLTHERHTTSLRLAPKGVAILLPDR